MVEQISPHQDYVVSLHCPKCGRVLNDVEFLAQSVTGSADTVQMFDPQQDQATQSAYDTHTHAQITEAQRRAWQEGRPTMERASSPQHHDPVLGVRGPMTQARNWREVHAPGGQASYVFTCTGKIKGRPCQSTPSIRQDTLVRLAREQLNRGEHHLTLS